MKRSGLGWLFLLLAPAAAVAAEGTAAGVKWTVPATWKSEAVRPMRVATYDIPAASGSEDGECGVFHFGQGQGGSVEENLTRWAQQFEGAAPAKKAERTVRGLKVHTIDVSGTYLASGGPMMKPQGKKPGYRLLGAIIEAPEGLVFFKCIGPAATLGKAQADFESLVGSLSKSAAAKL
ncbi:MAG TPA: hypothetical protein VJ776_00740 [Thermoanaerobaculia bacterium]|nr:hypothetical protein [Thermoanaerobaculia bacterium]